MAYCSNCGAEISSQAVYCPVCGTPAPGSGPGYGAPAGITIQTRPYAGWWSRVAAALIDALVVGGALFVLRLALGDVTFEPGAGYDSGGNMLGLAVGLIYNSLLEGSARGQTLGKMALGIAVRDDRSDASIGYPRAFVRAIVSALLWFLVIPGIVNVLFPLWDSKKQTLHDKTANSVVLRVTA